MTAPVRDAPAMLAGMRPSLREGRFVFCATQETALAEKARPAAIGWLREDEGFSIILEEKAAADLGFDSGGAMPMRRIVLEVFSALDGVGLTAAVSSALAEAGIPCNIVAAYHHDHLFVPADAAEHALAILLALQKKSS